MKSITYLLSLFLLFLVAACDTADEDVNPNANQDPTTEDTTNTEDGGDTGGGSGDASGKVFNVDKNEMLRLVNKTRTEGCTCGTTKMPPVGKVTWNDVLAKASYLHSKDMKENDYFEHKALDGSKAGDRIKRLGYDWQTYGENIAKGHPNEKVVVQGWIDSPGHCKNMMNGKFKEMGVGREGEYWTQVFGTKL